MITSLDKVKLYLGISGTASDAILNDCVAAADAFVLSYIDADNVLETDYVERYNGTGSNMLTPDHSPIVAITSLKINGRTIPASTPNNASGYFFDRDVIVLSGDRFDRGQRNVELSYRAGLAAIPVDMAQAATYIASQMYNRRSRVGVSSKTIGQESITYSPNDMDASSKTVLNHYKKRWLSR